MRAAAGRPRWLWWLGIVLAGASQFAPGGRDLPASAAPIQHPFAAMLYPTVGLDALVDRPVPPVAAQEAEPAWPGHGSVLWSAAAIVLAAASLVAAVRLARPIRQRLDRRVPSGRRRGPPGASWLPRARPASPFAIA
jgi:hypothetical protein